MLDEKPGSLLDFALFYRQLLLWGGPGGSDCGLDCNCSGG